MDKCLLIIFFSSLVFSLSANNLKTQEPLIIFHFDFNSVELRDSYVKQWLKKASDMGYNSVLWEIEDDVKWETCPECSSPDAFSKEQFKEILDYSRKLGLEPIPLLQTVGHAEYVLQHEKYFRFREDSSRYDCYCTSNSEVKKFLKRWIEEYLELFGKISYFHLGGDEAYAFASCDKCKNMAQSVGENKFYIDYIKEISEPLLAKGIRPGIWSDMILKHPNEITTLGEEFIVWDWNYWDGDYSPESVMIWSEGKRIAQDNIPERVVLEMPEIFDESGKLNAFYTSDFLKRMGYEVILCSSSRSYGDAVFAGRNDVHVDNIIGAARKTSKKQLFGTCVTSWAVRVHNYETQEPWFYLAPLTLKNPNMSKDELLLTATNDLFGLADTTFFDVFSQIGYSFPFANEKSTGIMWTGMKDSKPAPNGYIKNLISTWKKNNSWSSLVERIKKSTATVSSGTSNLQNIIPKVKSGLSILNNWFLAGYFQYWQSIIAEEIVKRTENNSFISDEELIQLINSLKRDYKNWAENWMTQKSAEQNAGLIYDSILEFFKY